MAIDRLEAVEDRIRDLVKLIQELKRKNVLLEEELRAARQRLASQDDANRRWQRERLDIKSRVEKVLGEMEVLECLDNSKEVALG